MNINSGAPGPAEPKPLKILQGLHFIINHSAVFKCSAQKSFHEIISCQYGKPVAYILKFKPGQQDMQQQQCGRRAANRNLLLGTMVAQNLQHVRMYECERVKEAPWKNIYLKCVMEGVERFFLTLRLK